MSESDHTQGNVTELHRRGSTPPSPPSEPPRPPRTQRLRRKPSFPPVKIRKRRVIALLLGLSIIASMSFLYGMVMAVASNLPRLEEPATRNSRILDRKGQDLGILTGNENRILVGDDKIAPVVKQAMVAIEDQRFYAHN